MTYEDRMAEAERLLPEVIDLYNKVKEKGEEYFYRYKSDIEREEFLESAKNLSYYLALRNYDIRKLQAELVPLGISSLGRAENKTLSTLQSVIHTLAAICQQQIEDVPKPGLKPFIRGQEQLDRNVQEILGEKSKKRETLIMVTMPTEAAKDKKLVRNLIQEGMNIARINLAHDDEKIWKKMAENIREIAHEENKDVRVLMDIAGPKIRTDWVFTTHKKPRVKVGDQILLTKDFETLPLDFEGKVVVGSDIEPIFKALEVGNPVLIDDGSVECVVESCTEMQAVLKVEKVKGNSVRIKAEKGLNFPKTDFEIDIMTEKDHHDIKIAAEHADVIGCSFVRNPQDIVEIQNRLEEVLKDEAHKMPLMAKIETEQAVTNLPEIIYTAASKNPFSVMIARGDLAVETGYIRLAEVQQEILWFAEAADVPVVWGTEVLANLIKTGIPSRAEVTDAAEGAGADCVMINKGEYAVEAVTMLDGIFKRMRRHQSKKTPQLRRLEIADLDRN